MLEVVEDQQERGVAQAERQHLVDRTGATFGDAEGMSDRRSDPIRIGHRCQRDKANPVRECGGGGRGYLEREPGLANAAGAGDGEEPNVRALEQPNGDPDFALTSDERREWSRQVGAGAESKEWRQNGDRACAGVGQRRGVHSLTASTSYRVARNGTGSDSGRATSTPAPRYIAAFRPSSAFMASRAILP